LKRGPFQGFSDTAITANLQKGEASPLVSDRSFIGYLCYMGKNSVGTAKVAEQPYPPKKRISGNSARMRDVAKRAGVSTMTVSRALNEPSKVSPEMRERVIRAVKEIGYLPNHLARSLSSTRSTIVGLIVPSIDNSIYTQTIKGFRTSCDAPAFS
jgi:hypothetical protein